jgi:plastocyanin
MTLLLIAGLVAVIVVLHDKDAVILTVITFVLLLFLPSKRAWVGVIGLALLFADVLFFTGAAAISNIDHHERLATVAPPAAFAALSVVGLLAGLSALIRYRSTAKGGGPTLVFGILGVLLFAGALVTNAVVGTDGGRSHAGEVQLLMKDTAFSPKHVKAKLVGDTVTVFVANKDFWWHTFTVDGTNVDLRVPEGGHRRVTFRAGAATNYKFRCAVPGHTQAGMKGTLVVEGGIAQ